jgi:hypothetical protein
METLIKDRMSTIVALILGSGGGWGLTEIITAPELKTWMITISVAVSFLLSLIISLSLIGRMTAAKRKKMIRKGVLLLIGFVAFIAAFFVLYNNYTIVIPKATQSGEISDTIIVKGLSYTSRAKSYRDSMQKIDQFRNYPSDDILLEDATYDIKKVWSDSSRTNARLMLLFLYTIMVCFFIAGVTLIAEVFVYSKKKPEVN